MLCPENNSTYFFIAYSLLPNGLNEGKRLGCPPEHKKTSLSVEHKGVDFFGWFDKKQKIYEK